MNFVDTTNTKHTKAGTTQEFTRRRNEVLSRLRLSASAKDNLLFGRLGTTPTGLSDNLVEVFRRQYGVNKITRGQKTL